jgi:hypothetical protein
MFNFFKNIFKKEVVNEIALHLSESAIYDLTFDRVEPITIDNAPTNTNVVVRMDIQDLLMCQKMIWLVI